MVRATWAASFQACERKWGSYILRHYIHIAQVMCWIWPYTLLPYWEPSVTHYRRSAKCVNSFLSRSAHRVQAKQSNIEKEVPNAKHHRLKLLCPTRWIDRHDSVIIFLELFPAIVKTLDDLQDSTTPVSAKASSILTCIEKSSFIVACCVIEKFAGLLYHSPEYSKKRTWYILSLRISRECRIRHSKWSK